MNANKIHAIARIKEDAIMLAARMNLSSAAPASTIDSIEEIIKNVKLAEVLAFQCIPVETRAFYI